jgi:hypothetical protein
MSVQGSIADMIAWYFPRKITAGPPKQVRFKNSSWRLIFKFAAFCGFIFSGVAAICGFADDTHIGLAICCVLLAGCAALEGFLDFCLGCFCFKYLVRFGLVPEHVISRCNDTYGETQAVLGNQEPVINFHF